MTIRPTNKELSEMFERLDASPEVDCRSFVMSQIKEGRARMRSRWSVLTEYLGLRTTWFVLVLSLVGILNLNLYIISRSPEWDFISFGPSGFWLIVKHVPYGWWTLAFAMMVAAVIGLRRFSFTYIWPFHVFAGLTVFGVFFAGTLAFATGMNDRLYQKLVEEPGASGSLLARIYCFGANRSFNSENALMGEVMDVSPSSMVVQTSSLEIVTVVANEQTVWPGSHNIKQFQVVKMLGQRNQDLFFANEIKVDGGTEPLHISRDGQDCVDKTRWLKKQDVVQRRRNAVQQPFTPIHGTAQLIKNIY